MLTSFDPTHININNIAYNHMKNKRSFIAYLILKIIYSAAGLQKGHGCHNSNLHSMDLRSSDLNLNNQFNQ